MAAEDRWRPEGEGGDDEEEEEVDETVYKSAKDAVLFVVEVSQSMLTPPPPSDSKKADNDTPTSAALKCAYALMQQRIISNPNDMMGVLLYGTEQSRFQGDEAGSISYPHCYLLTDLQIPDANDVKALKALFEDEQESKKLLVPTSSSVPMSDVLFCANQIFTTKAPNFSSRRLFIITDNDDPHGPNTRLKSSAAVRAKDLYDLGVIIELFPISRPGQDFDRSKFFDDIMYNVAPLDPAAPAPLTTANKISSAKDGLTILHSLLSSINSKAVARRALFSNLPLEIGPDFKISVKGFILLKRQAPTRSCYVYLKGKQPEIATSVTTQMADDTAREVEKVEIKKAYKFGGEQIAFTTDEIADLRHFGDPGIRIIGFKPISMLPVWATLKPATFIYPSEDDYVGSTRVFSALQQKLLKDQKMGLAWFVARKNAAPQIAAILPGAEKLDDDGMQVMPPGLWVAPLPFADDVRQNPETPLIRAPESIIDIMRAVVQQLQLPKAQYDPSRFPNPALQWHYRILQAMALGEDIPEEPEDKTVPKYKQIDKRAGLHLMDWGEQLQSEISSWEQENQSTATAAPSKRGLNTSGTTGDLPERSTKRAKTADPDDVMSNEDMRKAFDKNAVAKLTMPVMKLWLQSKGIGGAGKKADLVDRIEAWFERKS